MKKNILSTNNSTIQYGVREELASALLSFVELQGGFYVLYDTNGVAILSSANLPPELSSVVNKMLNLNTQKKTINPVLRRHKSTSSQGFNISVDEVYYQDEMYLLLIGAPEKSLVVELYNAFPIGVIKTDAQLSLKYCNTHTYTLLGLGQDELQGNNWLNAFDDVSRERIFEFLSNEKNFEEKLRLITQVITPLGRTKVISVAIDQQYDLLGHLVSYYIMLQDITQEYKESSYLKHLATHDSLTQLHNRVSLLQEIETLYNTDKISSSALLFIDLDKFKYINDNLGHHIGDELLKIVGKRLLNTTRSSDIVARIGGDEFVVILTNVTNDIIALDRAQAIVEKLNRPCVIESHEINVHSSIGLTMGHIILTRHPKEKNADKIAELWLSASDSAMYQAKSNKVNDITLYTDELSNQLTSLLATQNAINDLETKKAFTSFFQPIYQGDKIYALEALTRFDSDALSDIESVFEQIREHKRGQTILYRIIQRNLLGYSLLMNENITDIPCLNINIDLHLMTNGNFANKFSNMLIDYNIPPNKVFIEITERDTSAHIDDNIYKNIAALKNIDVRMSLDDFGRGYSSIERLIKLGLDQVKIDKVFLSGDLTHQQKQSALMAAVNLGKALDLQLLLEGIENEHDQALAEQCGVPLRQGYFYNKPMPVEKIKKLLGK
ncbi:diguanylate cyclase domain-containing protein [Catenovulum sediminis]|uniref:Diguanylate cyclase n=1 Tax=Catenovulum sediminis TaxID=1740262 RepID=A0ABV1RHT2_9ALTE|nr:diguanylate cyclase [Catenovulum sediminis]